MPLPILFCVLCGAAFDSRSPDRRHSLPLCPRCTGAGLRSSYHRGPSALVLAHVFAGGRLLLMQRGTEPYKGRWAPPGGFVENGESLESAAIRETFEEVGVRLEPRQLLPSAVYSLPDINQVYHVFNAYLDELPEARAVEPESTAVAWVSREAWSRLDLWAPAAIVDADRLFEAARRRRFDFHQHSDRFSRIISTRRLLRYLRGGD